MTYICADTLRAIFNLQHLKPTEKLVLIYLATLWADNGQQTYATFETIARYTRVVGANLIRSIRSLHKQRWIVVDEPGYLQTERIFHAGFALAPNFFGAEKMSRNGVEL